MASAEYGSSNEVKLRRELGLFSAVNLIVGVMIGSGIFVSPTSALERSGSVGLCLVVWLICGSVSLIGALAFAELGTVVPRSGAEYAYFLEAYGKLHRFWGPLPSFLCAWVYVVILRPAEVAVVTLTFTEYVLQPFADAGLSQIPQDSQRHLRKIISILTLGNVEHINKGFEGSSTSAKDIALAFYSGLWAFDGWSMVTTVTEEVKNPELNIPRSIAIAVPMVTLLYVMMNVSYMTVLSVPEMITAPAVAVVFGERILGVMSFIIPVGVALSTFGCALGIQFSVTRLCYVAGQEGHMVEVLSYVHMRKMTPAPAVVMQSLITLIFIIIGDIEPLIDFSSFLIWIFYGTAMVALLVMRKTKADVERPYKVPLIIPVFVILVAVFLSVVPIVTDPSPRYLFALTFIAMGVAVYTPLVYYKKRPRLMDKFTLFTQLLMEVVPTHQSKD